MPGVSLGPDDGRAGAVGEDERGAAVADVGQVREPLDADHQDVAGAAAPHHVRGQRDAVAEAGAGGRDVERRGLVGAELVGDRGRDRRRLEHVATRWPRRPRRSGGRRCRRARAPGASDATLISWTVSSGRAPAALLDAGALLDPLVAGVDRLDDLGVRDHAGRAVGAEAEDGGVRRPLRALDPGMVLMRLLRGAGAAAAGRGRRGRRPRRATRRPGRRGRR